MDKEEKRRHGHALIKKTELANFIKNDRQMHKNYNICYNLVNIMTNFSQDDGLDLQKVWPMVVIKANAADMVDFLGFLIHVVERYSFISYYLIYY